MKRRRFFIAPDSIADGYARLSPEESHHLRDVLRLHIGDHVELFDGQGQIYRAVVRKLTTPVELGILLKIEADVEGPLQLILGQSLIKGDKLDWVIQKCTELGMAEMLPLESRYSEISIHKTTAQQRLERWRRIALAASSQCRRTATPMIHPASRLEELCQSLQAGSGWNAQGILPFTGSEEPPHLRLVVSEKGGLPVSTLSGFVNPGRVLVLVGPEGGWSDEEILLFQDSGFHLVSLGNRILRSETAAVAITAILQYLWGDLAGG